MILDDSCHLPIEMKDDSYRDAITKTTLESV